MAVPGETPNNPTAKEAEETAAKAGEEVTPTPTPDGEGEEKAEGTEVASQSKDDKETSEDDPDAEAEPKPTQKKSNLQKRFDRLTRRNYELEADLRARDERLARIEGRLDARDQDTSGKPKHIDPLARPDAANYKTWDEYNEALIDWKSEQKFLAKAKQAAAQEDKIAVDDAVDAHTARVEEARRAIEDYDEVVTDSQLPVSVAMRDAIVDSDLGPEIMYYLGSNPEEAESIFRLGPLKTIRAIGAIEAAIIEAGQKPAQKQRSGKQVTDAPKPITPVGGGKGPSTPKPVAEQSYREYRAMRNAQIKKDRG